MSLNRPIYKLKDWVRLNIDKLNFQSLSENENAIDFLMNEYPDKIDWYSLSKNQRKRATKIATSLHSPRINAVETQKK